MSYVDEQVWSSDSSESESDISAGSRLNEDSDNGSYDSSGDEGKNHSMSESNYDREDYDCEMDSYDHVNHDNHDTFDDEQSSTRDMEGFGGSRKTSDTDGSRMVNNSEWWEGREKMIAIAVLCWCCLCLIIIGVVVGVIMGTRNRKDPDLIFTPRPTRAPQALPFLALPPTIKPTESIGPMTGKDGETKVPTPSPSAEPTSSPTISFAPTKSIPQTLGILADQDTYINLNGDKVLMGEENGKMDTFIVQNGPVKDETIPDTIALISFPFDEVPAVGRLVDRKKNAILRLRHVVSDGENKESATYTVIRIPETRMAVEFLHGFSFLPPDDDANGVLVGPSFQVNAGDAMIDVDITSLLFDYESESGQKPNQLLLMIENRGPEQSFGGDKFFSRETAFPPQLLVDFEGGNAADIVLSEKP